MFWGGGAGFADAGEEGFGGLVLRVLGDKFSGKGLGQQAFVKAVDKVGGAAGLCGQPVDAGVYSVSGDLPYHSNTKTR